MKRLAFLFLVLLTLTACATPALTATVTPTASPTPSPLPPTETRVPLTPTRIATAMPESSPLPTEAQTWVASHPEFHLQEYLSPAGLSVDFGGGKVVSVPPDQIAARIKVGQEDALQIYNETGDKILAAFDPETKAWVDADRVIQTNYTDMEKFIHVSTWDKLQEIFRLEKLFLTPFPEDTYFPVIDAEHADYQSGKFNESVLGNPPIGKEPTRPGANFILLEKGEDRSKDYAVVTEQVFNKTDKSFSALHLFRDRNGLNVITYYLPNPRWYFLPMYQEKDPRIFTLYGEIVNRWKSLGLYSGSGFVFTGIKDLTIEWLTTGNAKNLEKIPILAIPWMTPLQKGLSHREDAKAAKKSSKSRCFPQTNPCESSAFLKRL